MTNAVRAIDHVVLAARDLAAQAAFYERLGFLVGAPNRHPWGTENHIIQLPGSFIELISTGPGFRRPADRDPHAMSFPAFIADYLAEREGFAMLAMQSGDAEADRAAFKASGIGDFETFHFARRGRRPDGSETEVAFALAFARSPLLPLAGFFGCQHLYPANFWNEALQQHPNGATRIACVTMVAENPAAHGEFLSHLTGQRDMASTSMGVEMTLGNGARLEILTPVACQFRYGQAISLSAGEPGRLFGLTVDVTDPGHVAGLLEAAGVPFSNRDKLLTVEAESAFGVSLAFAGP